MRIYVLIILAANIFLLPEAMSGIITVDAVDNIYGAGHLVAPAPSGEGGGTLPPVFSFAAASGQYITFPSVTGYVTYFGDPNAHSFPDGNPFNVVRDVSSFGGIAGIITPTRLPLVGVFLTDLEPVDPAPARLDFTGSGLGTSFLSLSPSIGQVFFIGDGLTGTGTGTVQQFLVPVTATRLFLGFADSHGDPGEGAGSYFNNAGALTVNVQLASVPEPATLTLTLGAIASSLFLCRFQRSLFTKIGG